MKKERPYFKVFVLYILLISCKSNLQTIRNMQNKQNLKSLSNHLLNSNNQDDESNPNIITISNNIDFTQQKNDNKQDIKTKSDFKNKIIINKNMDEKDMDENDIDDYKYNNDEDIILPQYNQIIHQNDVIDNNLLINFDDIELKDENNKITTNKAHTPFPNIYNQKNDIFQQNKSAQLNNLNINSNIKDINLNYIPLSNHNSIKKENELHVAIKTQQSMDVIKFFCEYYGDLMSEYDKLGMYPLDYAKRSSNIYFYLKSLKAPSKIDQELIKSIDNNNISRLKEIASKKEEYLLMTDFKENTLLHLSCKKQNFEISQYLISKVPYLINSINIYKQTPLVCSIESNKKNPLSILLLKNKATIRINQNNKYLKFNKKRKSLDKHIFENESIINYSDSEEKTDDSGYSPNSNNKSLRLSKKNLLKFEKENKIKLKRRSSIMSTKTAYKNKAAKYEKKVKFYTQKLKNIEKGYSDVAKKLNDRMDEESDLNDQIDNLSLNEQIDKNEERQMKNHLNSMFTNLENEFKKTNDDQSIFGSKHIKRLGTLKGHKDKIWDLAISPNNKFLLSASKDNTIKTWNIEKKTIFNSKYEYGVICIDYSPINNINFISGGEKIKFWNINRNKAIFELDETLNDNIYRIKYNQAGDLFAYCSTNGIIKIRNSANKELISSIDTKYKRIISFAFISNKSIAVSGDNDYIIKIWDISSKKNYQIFSGHNNFIFGLDFNPKFNYLVSNSLDNHVKVWSLKDNEEKYDINLNTQKHIKSKLSLSKISLFQNKPKYIFKDQNFIPEKVSFSKNGLSLALINPDKCIQFYSASNGDFLQLKETSHKENIYNLRFSEKYLATCSIDGKIKIWTQRTA